jgi:hypothetical protein
MSISGSLQDVSVPEVMQFIYLGGRTGTLVLESGDQHAEVGFHRGRIISALGPGNKRLGDLLLEQGLVDLRQLTEALDAQEKTQPQRSLGQVLMGMGIVSDEVIKGAVAEQIEQTVYELVIWNEGSFEFQLDELRPVDDIGVYPGDILPDINLNTQMVVLEALRIFDEKNRKSLADVHGDSGQVSDKKVGIPSESSPDEDAGYLWATPAEEPTGDEPLQEAEIDDALDELLREEGVDGTTELDSLYGPLSEVPEPPEGAVRLQIATDDEELVEQLTGVLPASFERPARLELRDAGLTLPGESPPIVVVDLRKEDVDLERVGALARARKRAAVIVLVGRPEDAAGAYEAGALAAVPAEVEAVAACVGAVARNRFESIEASSSPSAFAKLKRVVADLRSGLLSASVALNLMNVISESVERAIMFLVRGDSLVAVGAFGFGATGQPLAEVTRGWRLSLQAGGALSEAISEGRACSVQFDEAQFPSEIVEFVGPPRTGQVVLFPVLGAEEVISVVYSDNGSLSRAILEIEILELASAQVGVAFENELLRQQMARQQSSAAVTMDSSESGET